MDEKLKKQGAISWSELLTSDVEAAKSYYQKLFGWTFEDAPMENMTYSVVKANDDEVAGIMPFEPDAPTCRRTGASISQWTMWMRPPKKPPA